MFKHPKYPLMIGLIAILMSQLACWWYFFPNDYYESQIVEEESFLPLPPALNCGNLRLTSPLGGLPNGKATFYWDALENAVSYRINLYASGVLLAGFDSPNGQTSLEADVSTNAVGGGQTLQVELIATAANGEQCSQLVAIQREWSPPPPPPANAPPVQPTPTCDEKPDADYC